MGRAGDSPGVCGTDLDGDLWQVVGVPQPGGDVEPKVLTVLNHVLSETDVLWETEAGMPWLG